MNLKNIAKSSVALLAFFVLGGQNDGCPSEEPIQCEGDWVLECVSDSGAQSHSEQQYGWVNINEDNLYFESHLPAGVDTDGRYITVFDGATTYWSMNMTTCTGVSETNYSSHQDPDWHHYECEVVVY